MKNKIDKKVLFSIIIGIILSLLTNVVAETLIKSADVSYVDNAKLGATNVQAAIDGTCTKFSNDLQSFLLKVYPVGSIYISYNSTNPGTLFGGTWEAFGKGQTLVGIDSSQTEFNTVGKTGGEKVHILTVSEMPSHTHTFTGNTVTTSESGAHRHLQDNYTIVVSPGTNTGVFDVQYNANHEGLLISSIDASDTHRVQEDGAHTHTVTATGSNSSSGGSKAHNNLQPYITVYMWRRTK